MVRIVVVTRAALLIARPASTSTWTVDEHLGGRSPKCVAVDPRDPAQVYCGTAGAGLFRSRDSGRNWERVGPGIEHGTITIFLDDFLAFFDQALHCLAGFAARFLAQAFENLLQPADDLLPGNFRERKDLTRLLVGN